MSRRRFILAPLAAALMLPAAAGADGACSPPDACLPTLTASASHAPPPALTVERVASTRAAAATRARRTLAVRVCVDRDALVAISVRRGVRSAVVVERGASDFVPAGCRVHRFTLDRAAGPRRVVVHAVDAAGRGIL